VPEVTETQSFPKWALTEQVFLSVLQGFGFMPPSPPPRLSLLSCLLELVSSAETKGDACI